MAAMPRSARAHAAASRSRPILPYHSDAHAYAHGPHVVCDGSGASEHRQLSPGSTCRRHGIFGSVQKYGSLLRDKYTGARQNGSSGSRVGCPGAPGRWSFAPRGDRSRGNPTFGFPLPLGHPPPLPFSRRLSTWPFRPVLGVSRGCGTGTPRGRVLRGGASLGGLGGSPTGGRGPRFYPHQSLKRRQNSPRRQPRICGHLPDRFCAWRQHAPLTANVHDTRAPPSDAYGIHADPCARSRYWTRRSLNIFAPSSPSPLASDSSKSMVASSRLTSLPTYTRSMGDTPFSNRMRKCTELFRCARSIIT